MPKFTVLFTKEVYCSIEIEAENSKEAKQMVKDGDFDWDLASENGEDISSVDKVEKIEED